MTEEVKNAIKTLVNELKTNETLASNWSTNFKENIIIGFAINNLPLEPDGIRSLIDGVDTAFTDLITKGDDPTSWVYNDKQKILDQKRALKSVKTQMKKKGLI
jgi:hypothetical protein